MSRTQPGAFATTEIGLLKTFADQAVIAIENVRVFKELEEKNHAFSEHRHRQDRAEPPLAGVAAELIAA